MNNRIRLTFACSNEGSFASDCTKCSDRHNHRFTGIVRSASIQLRTARPCVVWSLDGTYYMHPVHIKYRHLQPSHEHIICILFIIWPHTSQRIRRSHAMVQFKNCSHELSSLRIRLRIFNEHNK